MKKSTITFSTPITTGTLKGRKILLLDNDSARPTRNRLRQSIFNMLNSRLDLKGLTVLDACCGSGALGLEAYSRGSSVTLLDTNTSWAQKNATALGAQVTIVKADACTYAPAQPFDIILLDPPYHSGIAQALLARKNLLGKSGSWWVIETAADEILNWTGFADLREQTYGVSKIGLAKQL